MRPYASQWERLLSEADAIKAFITANASRLACKTRYPFQALLPNSFLGLKVTPGQNLAPAAVQTSFRRPKLNLTVWCILLKNFRVWDGVWNWGLDFADGCHDGGIS